MRIYWDQVLVDSSGGGFPTVLTRLDPAVADLHWRGFSAESTPDGREPFGYDYAKRVRSVALEAVGWALHARRGCPTAASRASTTCSSSRGPATRSRCRSTRRRCRRCAQAARRTFLLYVDGYSKEMDINSASPDSVEPLPFHAMTQYPYGPGEHYPHREAVEKYNTRVVSRGY